eukprot:2803859-Rhodomonas_salina.1
MLLCRVRYWHSVCYGMGIYTVLSVYRMLLGHVRYAPGPYLPTLCCYALYLPTVSPYCISLLQCLVYDARPCLLCFRSLSPYAMHCTCLPPAARISLPYVARPCPLSPYAMLLCIVSPYCWAIQVSPYGLAIYTVLSAYRLGTRKALRYAVSGVQKVLRNGYWGTRKALRYGVLGYRRY